MARKIDFRPFAYAVVLLGAALAFAAAVIPFYDAGYRLRFDVLLVGLLPYGVYGALTGIVHGRALAVAGALILAIGMVVTIDERFLTYDGYASGAILYAPLLSTLVILPLVLGVGAYFERRSDGTDSAPSAGKTDAPD